MPGKAHYDEFSTTKLRFGGRWTCPHCPVQAEGQLSDGRPWYFRARGGEWSLQVGKRGDEDAVGGRWVADGDDPWEGFMPAPEAAARIHSVLRWHDSPLHAAAFGCAGVGEPHPDVSMGPDAVDGSWWVTYWHRGEKLLLSGEGDFVVARCTATDAIASAAEVLGG